MSLLPSHLLSLTTALGIRVASLTLVLLALFGTATTAAAHQTIEVGDGAYRVVVGLLNAPLYVGEIEGIDLMVFDANDAPVENLEASLVATLVSPSGAELELSLRAQSGKPGYYTADFIPTVAGNYDVRVIGFIGEVSFDEYFDHISHADPAINERSTIEIR